MCLSLLVAACAEGVPDACVDMCAAAAPLQAACLDADGLDWTATAWGDAAGFVASCETWAWESRLLERDARRRGPLDGRGIEEICVERRDTFLAAGAGCEAYEDIDWDAPIGTSP